MPVFFIAVLAILLPIVLGAILAIAVSRFDRVVVENNEVIEQTDRQYNPSLTLGYKLNITAAPEEQFVEARRLAAAKAAAQPRGANMRIGRKGAENLMTAHDGVAEDPMTAVKIARFHGWDGARAGLPAAGVPQQPAAAQPAAGAPAAAPAVTVPEPEYIKITDDMSADEVRKARIANAKAKSAYNKALKAAGGDPSAALQAAPAAAPPARPTAAPAAVAGVPEPNYIEVTDDMSADEVRKARIANAKAKSAYNKALKAAGVDPSAAAQPQAAPAPAPAPAAAPAPSPAAAAGVPEPDYIEITDDMSADEVRKARIANAKAKSAYNKALKAAGIDPADVAAQAAPAPAAPAEPAPQAAPAVEQPAAAGAGAAAAAGIPEPDYIEITDDMSPDEIRNARINNAKAKSAYNKALKAAGIDPASVS
jgi:Arc/MetJ family transcription regulator